MLSADVAAGVVGDGHHQDGIDYGVGELRGFERAVEILRAGGVAAVGDDQDDLAAVVVFELSRSQPDRIVERRAGFRFQASQRALERGGVAREVGQLAHFVIEGVEGERVLRVAFGEQRAQEAVHRFQFVFQLLGRRAAVIDQQRDQQGLLGAALEDGDLLRRAIVENFEVTFFQRADEASGAVFHGGQNTYQADIHAKSGLLPEGESAKDQHAGHAEQTVPALTLGAIQWQPWEPSHPTLLPPRPPRRRSAPSSTRGPGASGD